MNEENRSVPYGRIFYLRQESGAVSLLYQDFAPGLAVTLENPPTTQNLFSVLEFIILRGRMISANVVGTLGG